MSTDLLSEPLFKNKLKQCQNLREDKDKLRMIKNVGEQFLLTPKQAIEFCRTCSYFAQTIEACVSLQYRTTNEDEFIHYCLDECKFPEDRVAMCAMLEIEYIPLPPKDAPKPKPVRKSIASGLGGGHAYMS